VPWVLTDEHESRKADFTDHYSLVAEGFLMKIFTGSKTWDHHFEMESKHQSIEWYHMTSPGKKKLRVRHQHEKSWLHSGDEKGDFLVHAVPRETTVNCVCCIEMI
jgi:hypothetical protein